jgi:putative nucleotidyltransferase with HDIG domain
MWQPWIRQKGDYCLWSIRRIGRVFPLPTELNGLHQNKKGGCRLHLYRNFVLLVVRSYVVGALLTLGVGATLFRVGLSFPAAEVRILISILAASAIPMAALDYWAIVRNLLPIRQFLAATKPTDAEAMHAFTQVRRLPVLAVMQICGPHYIGVMVPGVLGTLLANRLGYTHVTPGQIGLALVGAMFVVVGHATLEYFAISRHIESLLPVTAQAIVHLTPPPALRRVTLLTKFLVASVCLGVLPLLLGTVTAYARYGSVVMSDPPFWLWSGSRLLMAVSFAIGLGAMMAREVVAPVRGLQGALNQVAAGDLQATAPDRYLDEFADVTRGFNAMVRSLDAKAKDNTALIVQQQELTRSLLEALAASLDARDPYSSGHSMRVARHSRALSAELGWTPAQQDLIYRAGVMHDIGKIGVPDSVLLKEGKLTAEEFAIIQQHPVLGAQILSRVRPETPDLEQIVQATRHHHERIDGEGYPDGLAGESIPMIARIVAVADAYDAMTSNRPYRKGMSHEVALAILNQGASVQWDQNAVTAFARTWEKQETGIV